MSDNLFWRNRIIESGAADPQELAKGYNPDNWRFHPQIQRDALEDALDSIGVLQPVLFNRLSGKVIDGHLRIELAILKGQPLIPVNYVELTDDEEALALATLDAITEQAEPIPDKLAALLARTREMTADRPGLADMLQRLKERAGINGNGHQVTEDEPPQIDKAAELQKVWGTQVGQIWQLGNHRLAVGDCTDRARVEAVMNGERAALMITDPPYDGALGGSPFPHDAELRSRTEKMKVSIEKLYNFDPQEFLKSKLRLFCTKPAAFYFWCNKVQLPTYLQFAVDNDFRWYILTWHKPNFIPMNNGKYFPDTEYLFKMADKGATFKTGIPKELVNYGTYWVEEMNSGEGKHPTIKPLKPNSDQIQICTNGGDIVVDPFLGSGTTLIACEQLGRCCRGIELDPGYAAVSLQRFVDLSGLTPKRIS